MRAAVLREINTPLTIEEDIDEAFPEMKTGSVARSVIIF
ncbi:MAG: Zn-dependent alcohol dehydrogenase [Verrucomicrobiales bacterium]